MALTRSNLLKALADCDLNVSKAAKVLGVNRRTVLYQSDRMLEKTGLDPRTFYGLRELLELDALARQPCMSYMRLGQGVYSKAVCRATREMEECRCGGDRFECTFYKWPTMTRKEENNE